MSVCLIHSWMPYFPPVSNGTFCVESHRSSRVRSSWVATLFRASIVLTDIAVIPAPRLLGWDCFAASGRLFGGVLCFDMVEKGGRIEDCSR